MVLNCALGEDPWESLGLQGDPTSPSWRRSVLGIHWKDWCWSSNFSTLATWCEELTHLKRPWCWERLKVGGDGWMVSPTSLVMSLSKLWELVMDREPWPTVVQGVTKSQYTTEWPTAWCFPHGIIWVDFQDLRQIHRVYSLSLHNFVLGPNNIHTNPAKPCLAPLFFLFSSPTT